MEKEENEEIEAQKKKDEGQGQVIPIIIHIQSDHIIIYMLVSTLRRVFSSQGPKPSFSQRKLERMQAEQEQLAVPLSSLYSDIRDKYRRMPRSDKNTLHLSVLLLGCLNIMFAHYAYHFVNDIVTNPRYQRDLQEEQERDARKSLPKMFIVKSAPE